MARLVRALTLGMALVCWLVLAPAGAAQAAADKTAGGGGTIYVPLYARVFVSDRGVSIGLAATLSLRNTDPRSAILIRSVRLHDGAGALARQCLEAPRELPPLASLRLSVEMPAKPADGDPCLLVEWEAKGPVHQPHVEAALIGAAGQLGISFLSPGQPLGPPRP